MKIFGIDFTSRPRRRKPITCIECLLDGSHLRVNNLQEWEGFHEFEGALRKPGPWIAGIDLPFGQPRRFIETIDWPDTWQNDWVKSMSQHITAAWPANIACKQSNA